MVGSHSFASFGMIRLIVPPIELFVDKFKFVSSVHSNNSALFAAHKEQNEQNERMMNGFDG